MRNFGEWRLDEVPRIHLLGTSVNKLVAARARGTLSRSARRGFLRLSRRGDDPKLLHHAQLVHLDSILHYVPFVQAYYVDARHGHRLAGRCDPSQFALVGTAHGESGRYLVPFGDHLLDGEAAVGEGGAAHHEEVFVALEVHRVGAAGEVEAEVGGEDLVPDGEVVRAQEFLEEPSDGSLVLLYRHGKSPPSPAEVRQGIPFHR